MRRGQHKQKELKGSENMQIHAHISCIKVGLYSARMKEHQPTMTNQRVNVHLLNETKNQQPDY